MTDFPSHKKVTIIVMPNWIGDLVMALPAVQLYSEQHPHESIFLVAKRKIVPLLQFTQYDRVVLDDTNRSAIAKLGAQKAYVLPHSFRAAWQLYLARIPLRIGLPGQFRPFLLTRCVYPSSPQLHRSYEYAELLGIDPQQVVLPIAKIIPAAEQLDALQSRYALRSPLVLIPGAARGSSKRWPADRYIELAQRLVAQGQLVLVVGGPEEQPLCDSIADASHAISLAGRISLAEWIATLKVASAVIGNDSGGIHLAAALGTRTIALFGITDPRKTGPRGPHTLVIQHSAYSDQRIASDSPRAEEALARITVDEVHQAVMAS